MVKNHLKRLAAPKSWPITRKHGKFTVRPLPSGHGSCFSLPVRTIIRDMLGYAENASQVSRILHNKDVLVDARRVGDARQPVGLMDALSFPQLNESFRVLVGTRGKIVLEKISSDDAKQKLCRIAGKIMSKGGKMQLALHDGRTLLADKKDYSIGDSVIISLPGQEIKKHLKLEKGAHIYLTGGSHVGGRGTVETMEKDKLMVKSDGKSFEAKKLFAFVVDNK